MKNVKTSHKKVQHNKHAEIPSATFKAAQKDIKAFKEEARRAFLERLEVERLLETL